MLTNLLRTDEFKLLLDIATHTDYKELKTNLTILETRVSEEINSVLEDIDTRLSDKYDRITEDLGDQTKGLEERINKIEEYNERIKRLEHIVEDCCGSSRGRYNRHTKRNKTLKISRQK